MTDQLAVTPEPRLVLSLFRGLMEAKPLRVRLTKLEILAGVARRYGLTVDDLRRPGRVRRVSWPRQEAMWLMAQEGYGDSPIGHFLGLTSWTVTHGRLRHAERLRSAKVERCGRRMGGCSPLSTGEEG